MLINVPADGTHWYGTLEFYCVVDVYADPGYEQPLIQFAKDSTHLLALMEYVIGPLEGQSMTVPGKRLMDGYSENEGKRGDIVVSTHMQNEREIKPPHRGNPSSSLSSSAFSLPFRHNDAAFWEIHS